MSSVGEALAQGPVQAFVSTATDLLSHPFQLQMKLPICVKNQDKSLNSH